MRTTQALSITLPKEMARMVKAKVASGEYASESEVVRDGLRALSAHDAVVEAWLRTEVVPTYERIKANPDKLVGMDEASKQLAERMDRIVKSRLG
jgi:antitoxin ParD1/3/4